MPSEDEDILAKIGQLAGQINRHKNQTHAGSTQSTSATETGSYYHSNHRHTQASSGWRSTRGTYAGRARGYPRGGRIPQVHRNKTLILNGANTTSSVENVNSDSSDPSANSTALFASSAWVTKTDRHLQLINPAIFEKQSQQRAKAMEETRKLRLKQRDERERVKLSKHLQRLASSSSVEFSSSNNSSTPSNYEITVEGIRFRVVKNGSKLMKIPGDENAAKATPKTATIGGVRFYRSKNGNLYRSGIVKAQRYDPLQTKTGNLYLWGLGKTDIHARRAGVVKKIDEPCRAFSTTGTFSSPSITRASRKMPTVSLLVLHANIIIGTCLKGPKCRYVHDPAKVAVCKDFLQKGSCPLRDSCDLSHDLTPERTPACLHFAKGHCSNQNCRYSHIRVSHSAPVCHSFGTHGYCEKGLSCEDRHVHECPDFSNTGVCNAKGCKLPHKLKASVIRKNTGRGDQPEDDGSNDLSSDEDQDEIDSDDVDSDDLDEEYFGNDDGTVDLDIAAQQDFVQL